MAVMSFRSLFEAPAISLSSERFLLKLDEPEPEFDCPSAEIELRGSTISS